MEEHIQSNVTEGTTRVVKEGIHLNTVTHSYKTTISKEANIQGTKLMKVKKITDVVKNVVASKTDAMLFAYIVDNCKIYNMVMKESSKVPVTTEYLAKKFGVTVQKTRAFMRKAIEHDFIYKTGNKFFINPFTVIPFVVGKSPAINDQIANQLQIWWKSGKNGDPSTSIQVMNEEEMLEQATNEFMKTPKE